MLGMDMPSEQQDYAEQKYLEQLDQHLAEAAEEHPLKAAMHQASAEQAATPLDARPELDAEKGSAPVSASETTAATKAHVAGGAAEPEAAESSDGLRVLTPLVKEQLRSCALILKGLKRHPQAGPFQTPVDPVALGIPDYHTVITSPMDLSTIQHKVDTMAYESADQFAADVRLMLNNCFTYNQPETQVYQMGKALEKYFSSSFSKLPTELSITQGDDFGKRRKNDASQAAPRPKRESITPRRSSVIPSTAAGAGGRAKRANPEMGFCMAVWKELTKKSHVNIAWPFMEPVDPVKLGIPDYPTIITNPMDLLTVKKKLDTGAYPSPEAFEADIRLMLNNCYTYNGADSDVSKLGKELEAVFEGKWAQRASIASTPTSTSRFDEYDDDSEKILALNKQIQALQQELNELLTKRRGQVAPAKPASKPRTKPTSASAAGGPAAEPLAGTPMTFEEKRQLSIDVNNLSPEKLGRVVEIIHNSMPYLQQQSADSDVIELDIESLDVATLRQLQKYIQECKAASQKKRKAPAASAPRPKKPTPAVADAPVVPSMPTPGTLDEAISSDESSSSDDDL